MLDLRSVVDRLATMVDVTTNADSFPLFFFFHAWPAFAIAHRQGVVAAANFQRRQGNKEQACAFYEGAIQHLAAKLTAAAGNDEASNGTATTTTTSSSSSTEGSSAASDLGYLAVQYAHFQRQVGA
jgi:hypothetical protein